MVSYDYQGPRWTSSLWRAGGVNRSFTQVRLCASALLPRQDHKDHCRDRPRRNWRQPGQGYGSFSAQIHCGKSHYFIEYMDGGGGRQVGNHLFRNARSDGLTIGAFSSSVIELPPRETGVMYDVDKFLYLGSPESSSHLVFYTRKDVGLNSLEKLRATPGVRVGTRPVGT